jgi:HEAT repeat protein
MEVLDQVVPLLQDASALVRRAALLAVGPSDALIGTDDLLQWLHDPDEEVRELCEKALRGRGLQDGHLRLGRLMTDRRPAIRLQVLESLAGIDDLEPGVWLRRLSHDPAPAVRAAAIRTASEQKNADLNDRLEQMAQDDPCPTVRQLAHFYLFYPRAATDQTERRR